MTVKELIQELEKLADNEKDLDVHFRTGDEINNVRVWMNGHGVDEFVELY